MGAAERVHINTERQRRRLRRGAVGADLEGVAMKRAEDRDGFQQTGAHNETIALAGHIQLSVFFRLQLLLVLQLALLLGFQLGDFFGAKHISGGVIRGWRCASGCGGCGGIKGSNTRQFLIEVARYGGFDGLGALPDERLHGIERLAQGAGVVGQGKDMLLWTPGLEGAMEQFAHLVAVYLQASGSLVDTNLKDLFDLFIGQIGGLDQKVGQRRVSGDDTGSDWLTAVHGQRAGELPGWHGIAADEHDGGSLSAFAQDINQSIKQVATNGDEFGVGIVKLRIALKGEQQLLLIGKDALGVWREGRLINLPINFLRRRANRT